MSHHHVWRGGYHGGEVLVVGYGRIRKYPDGQLLQFFKMEGHEILDQGNFKKKGFTTFSFLLYTLTRSSIIGLIPILYLSDKTVIQTSKWNVNGVCSSQSFFAVVLLFCILKVPSISITKIPQTCMTRGQKL